MIRNGTGGANTNASGLRFKQELDLEDLLESRGYEIVDVP